MSKVNSKVRTSTSQRPEDRIMLTLAAEKLEQGVGEQIHQCGGDPYYQATVALAELEAKLSAMAGSWWLPTDDEGFGRVSDCEQQFGELADTMRSLSGEFMEQKIRGRGPKEGVNIPPNLEERAMCRLMALSRRYEENGIGDIRPDAIKKHSVAELLAEAAFALDAAITEDRKWSVAMRRSWGNRPLAATKPEGDGHHG